MLDDRTMVVKPGNSETFTYITRLLSIVFTKSCAQNIAKYVVLN